MKTTRILHCIFLFCCIGCAFAQPQPQQRQPIRRPMGMPAKPQSLAHFKAVLDTSALEGFSGITRITKGHEIVFDEVRGYAQDETKATITADTRFNIGSMNKMFTAIAIAILEERGKLDIRKPLAHYLPEFADTAFAKRVTLWHLLTHQSGMGMFWPHQDNSQDPWIGPSILTEIAKTERPGGVGERFIYSNGGFILLGIVVERVSGMRYEDFVTQNICNKAGMRHTGWDWRALNTGQYAHPYDMSPDGTRQAVPPQFPYGWAAGGGYATINDLQRFGQALVAGKIITQQTLTRYTAPQVAMGPMQYGLGFGLFVSNGVTAFGHNGGAPGVAADFMICPQTQMMAISLANCAPPLAMPIQARAMQWIVSQ